MKRSQDNVIMMNVKSKLNKFETTAQQSLLRTNTSCMLQLPVVFCSVLLTYETIN